MYSEMISKKPPPPKYEIVKEKDIYLICIYVQGELVGNLVIHNVISFSLKHCADIIYMILQEKSFDWCSGK